MSCRAAGSGVMYTGKTKSCWESKGQKHSPRKSQFSYSLCFIARFSFNLYGGSQISADMPFRLIEVTTDTQFEKMMPGLWEAMDNPRNVLKELSFPVKGEGPDAVANAMKDCKDRLMGAWHANPGGHFLQILDEDNGDAVVASAYWSFYDNDNNPFLDPGKPDPKKLATWWPEGSEIRKYTILLEDQGKIPKLVRQKRPHLCKHFFISLKIRSLN